MADKNTTNRPSSSASPIKRLIRACSARDKARKAYNFFSQTRDKESAEEWYQKLRVAEAECKEAQHEVWTNS